MDSFELNKIIGALLGAVFVIFSVSLISDTIFHAPEPETPGYAIAVAETAPAEGAAEDGGASESVLPLLASADVAAGQNVFKRCQSCHTVEEGGPNKVGPNLWDVVNRPIASHEGFNYSAALREFSEGGQVVWDYEHLDRFLHSPKGLVPGTAMSFAGLNNLQDRANIIGYLHTLSAQPAPLPEAGAPAEGAAPAQETAPAGPSAPPAGPTAPPAGPSAPPAGPAAPPAPAQTEPVPAPPQTENVPSGGAAPGTQPAPAQ